MVYASIACCGYLLSFFEGLAVKYELKMRSVEVRDLCSNRPFPPNDEDYEMYLNALFDDLSRIDCFSGLDRVKNDIFRFDTIYSLEAVKGLIKPLLISSLSRFLVFDDLKELP